jgi:hypothetical protein
LYFRKCEEIAVSAPTRRISVLERKKRPTGPVASFVTQMAFAATASPEDFSARHGTSRRGLIPFVAQDEVLQALYPGLSLTRRSDRAIVGFKFKWRDTAVSIDYRHPASIRTSASYLQASNRNLARLTRMAIEEKLALFLRQPAVAAWESVSAELGLTPWKMHKTRGLISLQAASRLAAAIVNEAIENSLGHERLGALVVAHRFPASLRSHVADALGAGPNAQAVRDLFHQLPFLALWPRAVANAVVGQKLKDIAKQLGLPSAARRVHPRAVGVISWLLRPTVDDDVDSRDFGWLTQAVCSALPAAAFRQKLIVGLAIRVAMRGTGEHAADAAIWLAGATAALKKERDLSPAAQDELAVYFNIDAATLASAVIDQPHAARPLPKAVENAAALANHLLTRGLADRGAFPLPSWAPDSMPLERSAWRMVRITDGAMLGAEARRLKNCSIAYADACARGEAVLYVIRRTATERDKPSDIHDGDITMAMAELRQRPSGGPRLIQLKGPLNAEPPVSLRQALQRSFPHW